MVLWHQEAILLLLAVQLTWLSWEPALLVGLYSLDYSIFFLRERLISPSHSLRKFGIKRFLRILAEWGCCSSTDLIREVPSRADWPVSAKPPRRYDVPYNCYYIQKSRSPFQRMSVINGSSSCLLFLQEHSHMSINSLVI